MYILSLFTDTLKSSYIKQEVVMMSNNEETRWNEGEKLK